MGPTGTMGEGMGRSIESGTWIMYSADIEST